jgi:hypothetical protein
MEMDNLLQAAAFLSPEKNCRILWTEGCVESRAGLDGFWIRENCPAFAGIQTPSRNQQYVICTVRIKQKINVRESGKNQL